MIISPSIYLGIGKVSKGVEKIKTHFMFNKFFSQKSCC